MPLAFMQAIGDRDAAQASREIGAEVDPWLVDELQDFVRYRLAQLAADPSIRIFLGRAIVVADADGRRHAIGSIGFHGPPDDFGRLEIGYGLAPAYRRRGYATEAVRAMLDWAAREHGVGRFLASIAPSNAASLRLASQFGFREIGRQVDEIDGLEIVHETRWPPAGS